VKFAFSRSTRGEHEREELFKKFGPAGFAGLQLKSNQYADYLEEPSRFLADWGQYPGVASALIHGGLLDDEGVAEIRNVIRFGQAVGSELVVYWPREPREGGSVDLNGFARRLSELGREARDAGLRLSLHHHYNQIVMTRDEFERFFAAIDPGTVGLTIDTAHLVKSGMPDVAGVLRDFAPVIDNIHLKDYGDGDWKVLGQGEIDFAPIFAAIREIGYDDWVCADEESGADFDGALAACFAMLAEGLPANVAVRP
jgi:sugar phosphate isomerase/epimerase